MNQIEKYSDSELTELKERCMYVVTSFSVDKDCDSSMGDIYKIALVEINRELDTRKIQAEGRKA